MVTPLLTDLYQFSMAYAYWKAGKHLDRAVFDLYFRKSPFAGEFTVFGGLEECIRFIANFKFKEEEINFLRAALPTCEDGFFEYLSSIDCSDVEVYAIPEGSAVFPKVPLMIIEGPVAVVQLLETPFLSLVNYASLVTTNAARHRLVAGKPKNLLEFGLRRAQVGLTLFRFASFDSLSLTWTYEHMSIRGQMEESVHQDILIWEDLMQRDDKYSYSILEHVNQLEVIPKAVQCLSKQTFIIISNNLTFLPGQQCCSRKGLDEIIDKALSSSDGLNKCEDFVSLVQNWLVKIQNLWLVIYVQVFKICPYILLFRMLVHCVVPLARQIKVMRSGVPNFCAVALALNDMGYKAVGIRLDSGDLAYLSIETRKFFCAIEKEFGVVGFGKTNITASNDLNEETIDALNKQGHEVDSFGIGTYLVTCYAQAALGCVFKLVEINKQPRIKLSEDVTKVSIPCKKRCYRLYGKEGYPLVDIMTGQDEPSPKVGERILCRHPFIESKRAHVVPQHVEELLKCYWPGHSFEKDIDPNLYPLVNAEAVQREELPSLNENRSRCMRQLERMRPDHLRKLNPTPYKVRSITVKLDVTYLIPLHLNLTMHTRSARLLIR
ncbi:Nicotinate phosphoribosyltransferase [Triticum urartu]|uniref:nicotinate phosphoribosyltransferase n=1 Tax=Triticum urartu TaxID=4572 RepID=M7Z3R5_TRIUA|nr:Nicotinate phosphoribosyltransferase [Triticum urartu]